MIPSFSHAFENMFDDIFCLFRFEKQILNTATQWIYNDFKCQWMTNLNWIVVEISFKIQLDFNHIQSHEQKHINSLEFHHELEKCMVDKLRD